MKSCSTVERVSRWIRSPLVMISYNNKAFSSHQYVVVLGLPRLQDLGQRVRGRARRWGCFQVETLDTRKRSRSIEKFGRYLCVYLMTLNSRSHQRKNLVPPPVSPRSCIKMINSADMFELGCSQKLGYLTGPSNSLSRSDCCETL